MLITQRGGASRPGIRRWTTAPAARLAATPSWQAAPPQAAGRLSGIPPAAAVRAAAGECLASAAHRCRQASRGVHPTDPVRRGWRLLGRPGGLRSRHGTTAATRAAAVHSARSRAGSTGRAVFEPDMDDVWAEQAAFEAEVAAIEKLATARQPHDQCPGSAGGDWR